MEFSARMDQEGKGMDGKDQRGPISGGGSYDRREGAYSMGATPTSGRTLLAVDPGKHACGFARFYRGELVAAWLAEPSEWPLLPADATVIVECPQVYRATQSKADPNDLIAVALIVGRVIERYGEGRTDVVLPRTWKGQIPKSVHGERIHKALSPEERKRIIKPKPASLLHNVVDAVGLGLWALKKSHGR